MTDHYTISGHNLDSVKQRNPTSIHPHALPAGPLVHVLPMRQPTAGHNIIQQSHAGLIQTHMSVYITIAVQFVCVFLKH